MENVGFFLLTREPKNDMVDFISELNNFMPAYIVVDNNDYVPDTKISPIILQLNDNKCYNSGFRNINFFIKKKVTSWDKVMYFLCREMRDIDFAWIVEDDVLVPSVEAVVEMTKKYSEYDLVTATDEPNYDEKRTYWHWKKMPVYMNQKTYNLAVDSKADPSRAWHKSMVCAMGISRNLLYAVNMQVLAHKELMFLEFMFNTICHQAGLKNVTAPEFKHIVYTKGGKNMVSWEAADVKGQKNMWFHPVKDRALHEYYRVLMNKL